MIGYDRSFFPPRKITLAFKGSPSCFPKQKYFCIQKSSFVFVQNFNKFSKQLGRRLRRPRHIYIHQLTYFYWLGHGAIFVVFMLRWYSTYIQIHTTTMAFPLTCLLSSPLHALLGIHTQKGTILTLLYVLTYIVHTKIMLILENDPSQSHSTMLLLSFSQNPCLLCNIFILPLLRGIA